MAKYFTDFSENPVQSGVPAGWTQRVKAVSGDSINIANDATMGRVMKLNKSGTSGSFIISNNNLNGVSDLETLSLFKVEDTGQAGQFGINYNRFSGTSEATTNGMRTSMIPVSDVPSLVIADASVGIQQYTNFSWNLHTWYWARFRTVGTEIKSKVWAYGTPEPANWNLDLSYSKTLSNPYSGVGTYVKNNSVVYAQYSAGAGGDEAPITTYNDTGWVSAGSISGGTSTVCDDFDFSELPDNISVRGIELHIIAEGSIDTFANVTLSSPAVDSASITVSNPGATVTYSFGRYDDSWGASWNKSDIENLAVTINSVHKQLFAHDAKVRVYYEVVEAPVGVTFSNGYMYRKKITAKSGYLSTNSFSGPMVVQGIFPELKAIQLGGRVYNTQDYHDILFTNENDVPLNWGIEAYNSSTGNLVAWVHPGGGKMLSSGSEDNRSIYMYYGKPVMENRTTNMAAVWSGYDFSLLMNGSQGGGNEYAYPQNEWFAPENANWETVSGAHGLARKFSGGGIYKNYEARYDLHSGLTLSMQVRFNSLPASGQNIPLYQIVGMGAFRYDNVSGVRRLNMVKYAVADQYVTASLNAGQWYHLTCVVDTSETRYYVNGAFVGSYANSSNFNPRLAGKQPSIMWPDGGGQVRLNVDIDTMSMVSNARPAWAITVEYNNQNRSDFWNIGAEEISALVIESAGHGFSSDDVTLIENSTLALDNALNGHLSQVVALIYHDVISTPNASSHSLTSQIGALVRNISLAMNSSTHSLTSDQVTVSFGHLLEMIDSVHTLSSTQVKLSQAQLIAIASTLHTIAGQTPLVTENKTLKNIGNTLHTTKSDMIKLLENYILAVESLIHGHESEQVVILQSSLLAINNALHGLKSDIVDILEYTLMGKPHDARHTVVSVNVGLVQEHILAVENALNVLKSDEGRITNWDTLGVGFGLYRSEYIHSGRLTGRNIQGYVQTDTYIPEYKQLGRLGLPKDEPTGRFVQKNITRGAF